MGTKIFRYQNQELIHYDQVLKDEAVVLTNKVGIKYEKKKIVPQEGGIYSDKLGQLVDDSINMSEYSCHPNCLHLVGRVWEGWECPECHCIVKNNYTVNFEKNGWINIGTNKVIMPGAYAKIIDLIGEPVLNDIITFNDNIDLQGNVIIGNTIKDKKKPFSNIGMKEFYRRFEEIINHYGRVKRKPEEAAFLIKYKNRIWTSKINVLSQELRPAFINSSESTLRYDSLNNIYSMIIINAALIAKAELTSQYMNINKYLYQIQIELYNLYSKTLQKLDGKKQLLRRKIQGTKMSWSSRMVITANTGCTYGLDKITISYKGFLELYKYEIINVLKKGYVTPFYMNHTIYEIFEWIDVERYSNQINPVLYACMQWLLNNTKRGLWCLVNRPPTLDLGSLQMLRIQAVSMNASESNMRVPLTSLKPWNADFDGDTLSVYSVKERVTLEALIKTFSPKNLIVNKISGYKVYNQSFGIPKELKMFMYSFVPDESKVFKK